MRRKPVHVHPAAARALANAQYVAESIAATLERSAAAVAEVSNTPWSQFSAADYDIGQWRRACLIDSGVGNPDSKDRYKLPVREPGGALNRNAIHAAAGGHGVSAVTGVSADKKKAAARKLAALYRNELGEDPPPSLLSAAGQKAKEALEPKHGRVRLTVDEAPTFVKTAGTKPTKLLVQLIKAGWSGNDHYYSEAVLRRDGPKTFPAGTLNFVDHATEQENAERPSGSLRNLASVQIGDAYYDPARKALMAEVRVFEPWREAVMDWADSGAIGMSIRAYAEGEPGKAEGKEGLIISALTEGRSVDYVAMPAAGGAIVSVLESLGKPQPIAEARNIGTWLESRLHLALTQLGDEMYGDGRLTREERMALSAAIGDALKAWTAKVEADAPALFARDLYDDPSKGVAASEQQQPEPAATEPPPEPSTEDPPAEPPPEPPAEEPPPTDEPAPTGEPNPPGTDPAGPASTEESRMTDNPGVPTPASPGSARQVIEAEVAQMRQKMAVMEARETARSILTVALADGWIPPATVARITESQMTNLPMNGGVLDEAELTKRAGRELARAEQEIAEAMQAAGVGRPRDLGQGGGAYTSGGVGLGEAEVTRRLEESFMALGNSEKVSKAAAKGRD